jgi:hypothetical protein
VKTETERREYKLGRVLQSYFKLKSSSLTIQASLEAIEESIDRLEDLTSITTVMTSYSTMDGAEADFDPHTKLIIQGLLKSRFPRLISSLSHRLVDSIIIRSSRIPSYPRSTQPKRVPAEYHPQRHDADETKSVKSVPFPSSEDHPYPDFVEELDGDTSLCRWCSEIISAHDLDNKSWKR